jgi:DNA-binding MarR family transcriptional regulator
MGRTERVGIMLEIEVKFISDNHKTMKISELAEHLGVTEGAISYQVKKLKLPSKNILTHEETMFMTNNYPEIGVKQLAKILGRSYSAINKNLKELGLKK